MRLFTTLFLTLIALSLSHGSHAQDRWEVADASTVRLPPAAFSQLPENVVRYLQGRGCTIPQTYMSADPHNVISGEFARKGQTDWAVLCSRGRESSIMVFWRGSTKSAAEIARAPDSGYLQTITEGGKIGFSRMIEPVGRDYIISHYKAYGGPKPPSVDHQGINDVFAEKASVVRYHHRGRWLELKGAD